MNRNLIRVGFFMVLGSLLLTMGFSSKIVAQPDEKTVYEGPFNGDWETTVTGRGRKFLMGLQQSRTTVTGRYQSDDGRFRGTILGTVTNNVLRFTWVEPSGAHGSGRLTLSSDGRSFQGTFSTTDNPDDTSGGTWNGTTTRLNRPSEGAPNPMGKMSEAEFQKKLAEYEERQRNAPATFQGVWRTKSGEKIQFPQLLFQQANNKVVGHLYAGRPDLGEFRDGVVERNTLRFTVWKFIPLPNGSFTNQYLGKGELVMDADGKSFTGTILGGATSGTRIAR
ncbi:MAG TPA: hypothetical protein VNA17_02385 [Pyrinomonadaceae bacterium]|nr:hypothetical protein [Pyrinomonadaceae bacterium]